MAADSTSESAKDAGFKSLMNTSRTMIYKTGKAKEVIDMRYQVLSEDGASFLSNYRIRFPSAEAKFKLLKAEVKTEGKVYTVPPEDVKISTQTEGTVGLFEMKEVVIPFNQVKVGSSIQVKYQMDREALIDGVFGLQAGIANNQIADNESQTFISEVPLRSVTRNFDDFYTLIEKKLENKFEIDIQPTTKARLLAGKTLKVGFFSISTAKSWLQLNQALSQKYEDAIQKKLPEAFDAIVEQAKPLKDPKAQIEKVAEGIKKLITYSGNWMTTQGKFYPSGHQAVIETAKGDCKDFAVSMVAILRALGFKADVALTFRNDKSMAEKWNEDLAKLPSLTPFNHAMVWSTDSTGKVWWIDPTSPVVMGDVLANDLLGNPALVLDGTTDGMQNLPSKNSVAGQTTVEQVIKVNADNSVDVSQAWELNAPAYNSIGSVEQSRGPEGLKQLFANLANPRSSGISVSYERTGVSAADVKYKVNLTASDWVDERKGKRTGIQLFHPATQLLMASKKNSAAEFLEEGFLEIRTKIVGRHVLDPIDHECYARSSWLDVDRVIDNVENDIVVIDRVNVKERHVSQAKENDEFIDLVARLRECAEKFSLVTAADAKQKTAEELELDKLKGPPVELMSAADAERLQSQGNLSLRSYVQRKLMKYYSSRVALDAESYGRLALVKRDLGYLRGDEYLSAYLEDGLSDIEKGFKAKGDPKNVNLLTAKIKINIDLKKLALANQDFKVLLEKAPKAFETYYIGYRLNKVAKNYAGAERWLEYAGRVAANDDDKKKYHVQMADLLREQNKNKEALAHYEEVLKRPNANAWDWHNAGTISCAASDWDKCIENEKRAIGLLDFAEAKRNLSWALMMKAKDELKKGSLENVSAPTEDLILQAIRFDPGNFEAHLTLGKIYRERYNASKKVEMAQKARSYLEKALALHPREVGVEEMIKSLQTPKVKATPAPASTAAPTAEPSHPQPSPDPKPAPNDAAHN